MKWIKTARLRLVRTAALAMGFWAIGAMAQLSSPIAGGLPAGAGAGVHGANSPFAPIQQRAGVLPWSTLTAVKTKVQNNRLLPVFPPEVQALNKQSQRIQGFMMPLEPGERHTHFLLSAVPLTCSFCIPGGPESMVEVRSKTPIKYSMEVVAVEGLFSVMDNDPSGLYYRMSEATPFK